MNIKSRVKFAAGIAAVVLVVGIMLVRLQYDMSKVASQTAQLQSTSFTIGSDYSGVVIDQFVSEGDTVHIGDKLFELHSTDLATALSDNTVADNQNIYMADGNGNVIITAAADGIVQTINYPEGAFVPANSNIATIDTSGTTYVLATFKLTPPDYRELHNGNKVIVMLPDYSKLTGKAYGIALKTTDSQLYTTVKVRLAQSQLDSQVFTDGTPVQAQLQLDTTTWYASIVHYVQLYINLGNLRRQL